MCVNSRKAGAGTFFWKHQLHETCGEQLTTAIVVVGAPDMRYGGGGNRGGDIGWRGEKTGEEEEIFFGDFFSPT